MKWSFPKTSLIKRSVSSLSVKSKNFGSLNSDDLNLFKNILGKKGILTDDIEQYNTDFMKWYKVSAILRHCYHRSLPIVPQSGNTGLVGGSVPVYDEIVLSLRRLNKNFNLDTSAGILSCDSGFVLEQLDNELATHGYMMPIDLGAKGSCLVGGNVATNAGGIRLIKYGSMHANVLGLQVVIPDEEGSILTLGTPLRKDNSDIHLANLFIGSEGQFGIITKVQMIVVPKPVSSQTVLLGVESFDKCLAILKVAKRLLSEVLTSFEMMDCEALRSVKENMGMESSLSTKYAFNLLIEVSGSNANHDIAKFEQFFSHCIEEGLAEDGIIARSVGDAAYLWKIRENIPLAQIPDGYVYKHDFSLPLAHFYELTEAIKERLGNKVIRVVTFGHLGDGNTHLNVTTPAYSQEVYELLYPFIYEWVSRKGGSISAEHGIGQYKLLYHKKLIDPKKLKLNKNIKQIFDPKGLLSPYKMIDMHGN